VMGRQRDTLRLKVRLDSEDREVDVKPENLKCVGRASAGQELEEEDVCEQEEGEQQGASMSKAKTKSKNEKKRKKKAAQLKTSPLHMSLAELQNVAIGSLNIDETNSDGQTAVACTVLEAADFAAADIDFEDSAADENPLQRLHTLLKLRADPNLADAKECTPLHIAAMLPCRSAEIIQALTDHGANTEALCQGSTPLMLAVQNAIADTVPALVQCKANPNTRTKSGAGKSALEEAIDEPEDQHRMAQLLLECKADPNTNSGKLAMLHKVVAGKDATAVAMLLRHKADVSVTEQTGKMPHHLAARAGCTEILKMLLSGKADVNALSKEGKTALQLAEVNRKAECVELLQFVVSLIN